MTVWHSEVLNCLSIFWNAWEIKKGRTIPMKNQARFCQEIVFYLNLPLYDCVILLEVKGFDVTLKSVELSNDVSGMLPFLNYTKELQSINKINPSIFSENDK